jgi:hypothetical protein
MCRSATRLALIEIKFLRLAGPSAAAGEPRGCRARAGFRPTSPHDGRKTHNGNASISGDEITIA